jgi:ribosomal protein S18 acetylase RimI-like enzyme
MPVVPVGDLTIARADDAGVALDAIVEFIVRLNRQPSHQIGYLGEDPVSVRNDLTDRNAEVADALYVALAGGELAGVMTLDADAEVGRTWIYGPWIERTDADAVADALWHAVLPHAPADAPELELFCSLENGLVRRFAERHRFAVYSEAVLLRLARGDMRPGDASGVAPLAPADHDAFAVLHDATFPRTFLTSRQIIERIGEDNEHAVFVTHDDAGLTGSIYAELYPESGDANIEFVAVEARARGTGVGTRLVAAALGWIFARAEINEVVLNTQPDNHAALRLYERAGFTRGEAMIAFRRTVSS